MGAFIEFLKECSGFLEFELNMERSSGEAPLFTNQTNQFLNQISTSSLLQNSIMYSIYSPNWGIPPFLQKKAILGFAIHHFRQRHQSEMRKYRVFLDNKYIRDFSKGRTLILFGVIREILSESLRLEKEICSIITFIIFLHATKNLEKLSFLVPFLPKTINISPTFSPTIRNSFLTILKYMSPETYATRFFRMLEKNDVTKDKVIHAIFHSFNSDFSFLNEKEIEFFQILIKEGIKPLREYQTNLSVPTRSRYLSKLIGTYLLRMRSFFNLENLGLESYYLFIEEQALDDFNLDLTNFSFLRSIRRIGSYMTVNFFYRKGSPALPKWYALLKSCFGEKIRLLQQSFMEAYFHPILYNANKREWKIHWGNKPVQVVEQPTPLKNITELHLRVALEMMKEPYNKSTVAKKMGGNRNKVYSIITELEKTKTVYLKYVMAPHHSLVPLTLFGQGNLSEYRKYAQILPFSVLYFLKDIETNETNTLSFYRIPAKYITTVGRSLKRIKGTHHFDIDFETSGTSPRYAPHFSKGTWKLKPLPRPKTRIVTDPLSNKHTSIHDNNFLIL